MDAKDFLKIAKKLLKYNSEANWRTSIGRSYYAIFNYLKQECRALSLHISSGSAGHGELKNYLQNCGIDDVVDIGSKIGDLYSQRIIADYKLGEEIKQNTAKLMFEKAQDISKRFPSIDKPSFKAGVEKYIAVLKNSPLNLS
jgi:uncharacterized protein (UPF0332 family)